MDELNSHLGLVRAFCGKEPTREVIRSIQGKIAAAASQIAATGEDEAALPGNRLGASDVADIEELERAYLENATLPRGFAVPGDTPLAARVDIARAVCRRAERRVVSCMQSPDQSHLHGVQRYLNRLSDLLFILARVAATEDSL